MIGKKTIGIEGKSKVPAFKGPFFVNFFSVKE